MKESRKDRCGTGRLQFAFLAGLLAFAFTPAEAADGSIGPVYIQSVTAVNVALGGHAAGNVELAIQGGFTPPTGVSCIDTVRVTTLRSSDPDKRLFALATSAQLTRQPVFLAISDDASLTAYPGRCSVKYINLSQ